MSDDPDDKLVAELVEHFRCGNVFDGVVHATPTVTFVSFATPTGGFMSFARTPLQARRALKTARAAPWCSSVLGYQLKRELDRWPNAAAVDAEIWAKEPKLDLRRWLEAGSDGACGKARADAAISQYFGVDVPDVWAAARQKLEGYLYDVGLLPPLPLSPLGTVEIRPGGVTVWRRQ